MATCKPSEPFLNKLRDRYQCATKKQRGRILDEFVETTGYHRKHAIALLRSESQHRNPKVRLHRVRPRIYTEEDQEAVLWFAELFDQIGSKRLRAAMDAELPTLREERYLRVSPASYQRLLKISPATMDRLRKAERRPSGHRRGGTKPGSLLKHQIPIRTFADWDERRPGFTEVDLVQHDGGFSTGFYACTLNMTDVCTGWTELRAVRSKARRHVLTALAELRRQLPFPLLGVDSDNGSEFTLAPAQTAGAVRVSMLRCGTIVNAATSRSRELASDARTTMRMSSKRTGRWCGVWSVMSASIHRNKWSSSIRSMESIGYT